MVCPGKDHSPQPYRNSSGEMRGRHPLSPNLPAFGDFCRAHKYSAACCQNSPYLLCISSAVYSWGSSEKMAPVKGSLASGKVNEKSQESQEAQVGKRDQDEMGDSLPCRSEPHDPMAGQACEQAGYPGLLGSAVSHTNPSSGREAITLLNWSNLDEDYMGILNCCTSALPSCFAKDCTDRQAFIYINK